MAATGAPASDSDDPWNWPYMYWYARKYLKVRSEVEFRRMRPVTYFALLLVEIETKKAGAEKDENVTEDVAAADAFFL